MGLLELVLIILLIAAIAGRGPLALGTIFDVLISILVIILVYRLIVVLL